MNQRQFHFRARGLAYCVSILLVSVVLLWWGLLQVVLHPGQPFPTHVLPADVVVPLAGSSDRMAYATSLVEQGIAPGIMSTLVDPLCLRTHGPGPRCATHVHNTIDEAVALRRIFDREGFTRVIVVTSSYHLARAAAIIAIVFAGSNPAIHFLAPPETTTRMSLVNREVASYLPSLVAAVMARSVPALYEWTVQRRAIRQDSRSASRR